MIASLKFHAKNEKEMKKVEVAVKANLDVKVVGVGIGGQFKKLASAVKDMSTLTIKYTATAPLITVPTDIDSLVKAIKEFPSMVRQILITIVNVLLFLQVYQLNLDLLKLWSFNLLCICRCEQDYTFCCY